MNTLRHIPWPCGCVELDAYRDTRKNSGWGYVRPGEGGSVFRMGGLWWGARWRKAGWLRGRWWKACKEAEEEDRRKRRERGRGGRERMRRRRGKRESEVEAWPPRGPVGVQQPFTRHKRRNKRRLGAKQLKTLRPIALHRFLPFHPYPFLSFFFFLCVSHPIYPTVSPSLSLSLSRERFFSR